MRLNLSKNMFLELFSRWFTLILFYFIYQNYKYQTNIGAAEARGWQDERFEDLKIWRFEDLKIWKFENLRFEIWDLGFGIWILEFVIWDLRFEIWNLRIGIWDLRIGIWDLRFGICYSKVNSCFPLSVSVVSP